MKTLESGAYLINAQCPQCHVGIEIPVTISTRLTMDDDTEAQIRIKLTQKAVAHTCGQGHLFSISGVSDGTPNSTDPAAVNGDADHIPGQLRADDWAERQAGGRDL